MVDLERTEKEYADKDIPFPEDKMSELGRVKKWKHQVTSEAGNFNQNPDNKSDQYPKKIPTQIIRKKILDEDGKEYLTTIETWYGRDGIGNEVRLPVSEPQSYDTPIVRKHREYQDGRDVVKSESDGYQRIFTVPFSEEAFREVYNRSRKSTVTMMVQEVGRGRKEVAVKTPEELVQRDFYDILNGRPYDKDQKKDRPQKVANKISTIEGEVIAE